MYYLNIHYELEKYHLNEEWYEKLLQDCCDKVNKESDMDWSEIASKYGVPFATDTLRKACATIVGGPFVKQYIEEKRNNKPVESDKYFEQLRAKEEELYKLKRQMQDQRREYNKLLTSEARSEHLHEEIIRAANNLNHSAPLLSTHVERVPNTYREALLCLSDWHYGMVTDNIWNTYNTDICKQRLRKLARKVKDYLILNRISTLHVVMLGDFAHGAIHTSARVQSEENTCDQLMHVAELLAEFIDNISEYVNELNLHSCYGNHMRTVQDKNDSVHSDNMEKVIPWWLEQRLKGNEQVKIHFTKYYEFTKLNILGYNICCVHGDLDSFKNIGTVTNTIFTHKFNEKIDYTISGDKHHLEEFEQLGVESILIRSLCGTDDYANNKRLYSKPGQTMIIFNNEDGRESTYHISL